MKTILILSVLGMMAAPAFSDKQKMMQKMAKYNLLERCWGRESMTQWMLKIHKACEFCEDIQAPIYGMSNQQAPLVANQIDALRGLLSNPAIASLLQSNSGSSFGRRKRQANGLLNPTEEEKEEFYEDFMDFKSGMMSKMGNLSCVLTQMEMIDASGNINMETYSMSKMKLYLRNTPAGSDPVFLRKMADGFSDCYDISRSFPQQAIDRHHPLHKEHARHMIFFECTKKMEEKMCTKFQINQWLETMYGPLDNLPQKLNLPVDKYDASAVALKTMYSAASDEMKFVDDFFWGPSKM